MTRVGHPLGSSISRASAHAGQHFRREGLDRRPGPGWNWKSLLHSSEPATWVPMRAAFELLGAVALEFAAATAFYPALGRPGRVRFALLAVLWPVIMASPLLVGFGHPFH